MSRKEGLVFWGKLLVTVIILGILVSRVDLTRSIHTIRESAGLWWLAAFGSYLLGLITAAHRWEHLLRGVGIRISKLRALQLHTIGVFANRFLPGAVGGDLVRWHLAGQQTRQRLKVAATIMMERTTGITALVALCLGLVLMLPRFATMPVLLLLVLMSMAFAFGLGLAFNRWLATSLMFRTRHHWHGRIMKPLYKLQHILRSFQRKTLTVALGYSMLFYVIAGMTFFCICKAVGAEINLIEATAVQALVCLLIIIPISLGGLGLEQAGDVYLLSLLEIDAAHALAISIMRLLIICGYAAVGGLLFILWRVNPEGANVQQRSAADSSKPVITRDT
jgi:hypothetical protein